MVTVDCDCVSHQTVKSYNNANHPICITVTENISMISKSELCLYYYLTPT